MLQMHSILDDLHCIFLSIDTQSCTQLAAENWENKRVWGDRGVGSSVKINKGQ